MFSTALAIALSFVLAPQDAGQHKAQAKPQDASAKRASIESTIKAALHNTPGMKLTGRLDRDSPFAGMGFGPSIGGGLTGKFEVSTDKNGVVYAVVDADDGKLEIWHKDKKTAQRFTWSGASAPQIGNVAGELLRLFDFGRVARELGDADHVKKTDSKPIAGKQCQGYSAVFGPDLLAEGEGGNPMRISLSVKKIEASFWLDAETGALVKADFNIVSGLPQFVRIGIAGAGGGGGQAPEMKFATTYSFVAKSTDPELTHKIPEEIHQKLNH